MRKLFTSLAVGALRLSGAQTATAGSLTSATLLFILGTLPAATVGPATGIMGGGTAAGTGATATWTLQPNALPTGAFTTTLPSSAAPPLTKIQVVLNGNPVTGNFSGSSPVSMSITGVANVKSYGGITLLGIPIVNGVTTTINAGPSYGVLVTAFANKWTTKTTTVQLLTPTDQGATTAKVTGSNGLVNGNGTVVMVAALNVLTNIAGQFAAFSVMTLNYAPEPGTLLLLGSGVLGLAVLGRRNLKK
jgi:hypothetical protein